MTHPTHFPPAFPNHQPLFLNCRSFGADLVRLSHDKSTSCFDVYDVSGYGSQMQKQVFSFSRLAHFCRGIRLWRSSSAFGWAQKWFCKQTHFTRPTQNF